MFLEKEIYIATLNESIKYIIGKNSQNNFDIIDHSNENDIWFHLKDYPSTHVVVKINKNYNKKELKYILKQGSILCKQNSKYKSMKNISIVYTKIKNVQKTSILGTVEISNEKIINI